MCRRRAISCYPELAGAEGQPAGEGEGEPLSDEEGFSCFSWRRPSAVQHRAWMESIRRLLMSPELPPPACPSCHHTPALPAAHLPPPGLASMFNFSHAARVTPNRVCCNALLAAYARAKPPQYQRVSWGMVHGLGNLLVQQTSGKWSSTT